MNCTTGTSHCTGNEAHIADTLRLRAGQVHVGHGPKPQLVGTQTAQGIARSIKL